MKICPQCKMRTEDNHESCPRCGANLYVNLKNTCLSPMSRITLAGMLGVMLLSLFSWAEIPNGHGLTVNFNLINLWVNLFFTATHKLSHLKLIFITLTVAQLMSFLLLMVSLIKNQSKVAVKLAYLGFGLSALVPTVFVMMIQNKGSGLTVFPFLAFACASFAALLVCTQSSYKKNRSISTVNLVRTAVLGALAAILFMWDFPIFPAVPFLKLDFSNVPVMLGSFAMGPFLGSIILLVKAVTGLLHTTSSGIGELADLLIGLAFVVPGAMLYQRKKTRKNALHGMCIGIVSMVVIAILANYYILLPFFSKFVPYDKIIGMGRVMFPFITDIWHFLLTVTALFNFIKGIAICVLTYLLYKPLSPLLHNKL